MRVFLVLVCALPSLAVADTQRPSDEQFLDKAFSISKSEVQLGQLAEHRGASPEVRDFGARVARDYQQALDTLPQAARDAGVMMPTSIQREESDFYTRLMRLYGKEFDEAYRDHVLQGNQRAIALFDNQADHGNSAALRQWAATELPVLKQHESIAKRDLSRM